MVVIVGREDEAPGPVCSGQLLVPTDDSFLAAFACCLLLWSVGINSSFKLHESCSSCCVQFHDSAVASDGKAFSLLGTCRRRVRASLLRFLRFGGREPPDLSSVMDIQDLQLNPLPHGGLPMRLLVEPLALRLDRLQGAPEEYDCRSRVRFLLGHPGFFLLYKRACWRKNHEKPLKPAGCFCRQQIAQERMSATVAKLLLIYNINHSQPQDQENGIEPDY